MKVAPQVHASNESRVVVGLGATGLSCARYLYAHNLPFCVIDSRKQPPGLDELQREMPEVQVYAGDYPAEIVAHASELVVSPGVAMSEPIIREALTAGVAVVGDIDLFMRAATAPVVGITGSNAKSTVTELLGKMAGAAQLNVGVVAIWVRQRWSCWRITVNCMCWSFPVFNWSGPLHCICKSPPF